MIATVLVIEYLQAQRWKLLKPRPWKYARTPQLALQNQQKQVGVTQPLKRQQVHKRTPSKQKASALPTNATPSKEKASTLPTKCTLNDEYVVLETPTKQKSALQLVIHTLSKDKDTPPKGKAPQAYKGNTNKEKETH